jgi:hypothetical protein
VPRLAVAQVPWRYAAIPVLIISLLGFQQDSAGAALNRVPVSASPLLGVVWSPYQSGIGTVRPSGIGYGGDPTGYVRHVTWESWGGTQAIGHGIGWYVGPNTPSVADGRSEPATIVAWDLGNCLGHRAYLQLSWFFTTEGQKVSHTGSYDICSEAIQFEAFWGVNYPAPIGGEHLCGEVPFHQHLIATLKVIASVEVNCRSALRIAESALSGTAKPWGWSCDRPSNPSALPNPYVCALAGRERLSILERSPRSLMSALHVRATTES